MAQNVLAVVAGHQITEEELQAFIGHLPKEQQAYASNPQFKEHCKAKAAVFAIANVVAHVIGWVVVAPVLDILIYAEPAKKVFAQGAFAAVSNTITGVVVGGLLILAYTKTIAKNS